MAKKTMQFTITLPVVLAKTVRDLAEAEKRNVSNMISVLVEEAVSQRG